MISHFSRSEQGQAMVEYILMIAIVTMAAVIVKKGLDKMQAAKWLMRPIQTEFAAAYQYGHPKAKGYDDGGPQFHPRAVEGGTNFRIFISTGGR